MDKGKITQGKITQDNIRGSAYEEEGLCLQHLFHRHLPTKYHIIRMVVSQKNMRGAELETTGHYRYHFRNNNIKTGNVVSSFVL